MKSKLYKVTLLLAGYFIGSCLLHYIIFPEPDPPATAFPKNGDVIENPMAGEAFLYTKDRFTGDPSVVQIEVELLAQGSVPIAHIHANMNEVFTGLLGETHLMREQVLHKLKPGESQEISAGDSHLPFNPGPGIARVKVSMQPVGVFDLCLVNIHRFLASTQSQGSWFTTQLQLARYAAFCDVYRADHPVWLQQASLFLAVPTLRALGFKAWEE